MPLKHTAFIMYPVTDMPRAVGFYEKLGLKKAGLDLPYWVEFDVAGTTFGIGNFEQVGKAGTAQSLALEVEDLPGYRAELAQHGIEATPPHDLEKCVVSVVTDPDGNQVWLHALKAG